jgi:hypothetical protein
MDRTELVPSYSVQFRQSTTGIIARKLLCRIVGDKERKMSSTSPPKRYVGIRAVRRRYGDCSARTIDRWVKAGVLPAPDQVINNRRFWSEDGLDRHDRRRTVEAATSKGRPGKAASVINPTDQEESVPAP